MFISKTREFWLLFINNSALIKNESKVSLYIIIYNFIIKIHKTVNNFDCTIAKSSVVDLLGSWRNSNQVIIFSSPELLRCWVFLRFKITINVFRDVIEVKVSFSFVEISSIITTLSQSHVLLNSNNLVSSPNLSIKATCLSISLYFVFIVVLINP